VNLKAVRSNNSLGVLFRIHFVPRCKIGKNVGIILAPTEPGRDSIMANSETESKRFTTGNKIAIASVTIAAIAIVLPLVWPDPPDCDKLDDDALDYHKQHRSSPDRAIERALAYKFKKYSDACGANDDLAAILLDWHGASGRCAGNMPRGPEVCAMTEQVVASLNGSALP
jgi:hypothetical protein